jgi:hypothetical protein
VLYVNKNEATDLVSIWKGKNAVATHATHQPRAHAGKARPSQKARSITRFLLIVGAALCVWRSVMIAVQYPSSKWPSTEGKIISQYYREFPYDLKHRVTPAQLELRYAYTVAGIAYESDRFSLFRAIYQDPDNVIRAFADQHRKGMPVTVYYKPGNPREAVLQTGPDWRGDFALILFGGMLAGMGLLMHVVSVRAAQERARARLQSA